MNKRLLPISLVIPCLNEEAILAELFDGLDSQEALPQEIIFVDAGSTDQSATKIAQWVPACPDVQVRIIKRPKALPGAARNAGIACAQHPWVAFLDCGIKPSPGWLKALYDKAKKNGVAAWGACQFQGAHFPGRLLNAYSFGQNTTIPQCLPASLFHKKVFEKTGPFREDLRAAEDELFRQQYTRNFGRTQTAQGALVSYRHFPASLWQALKKYHLYAVHTAKARAFPRQRLAYLAFFSLLLLAGLYYPMGAFGLVAVYGVLRGLLDPVRRSKRFPGWAILLTGPLIIFLLDASKAIGFIRGSFVRELKTDCDSWNRAFKYFLAFSLAIHLVGAYFSEGHHRLDEHDGILVNTAWKLGILEDSHLHPHEIPSQIRSWIQPGLYFLAGKVFFNLGGDDPFTLVFFLRLLSSLIGFLSLIALARLSFDWIGNHRARMITLFALASLWYYPFYHARTTAENLTGSFFVFALYLLFRAQKSPAISLASGILLGMSFEFRFQSSVMIFFLLMWLLRYQGGKRFSQVLFGVLVMTALGRVIDYWGYSAWAFSPWNYWHYNIIQGVASKMGVDPWWRYLYDIFLKGIPPLSLIFLLPTFWLWIKRPNHVLVWATLPFFVVHCIIEHKELRFLYPLGLFTPILLGIFLEATQLEQKKWAKIFFQIIIAQNFLALAVVCLRPAYGEMDFWRTINKNGIKKIYHNSGFPKIPHFYLKNQLVTIKTDEQFKNCQLLYSSYPEWIIKRNFFDWTKRSKIWTLYQCSKSQQALGGEKFSGNQEGQAFLFKSGQHDKLGKN